MGVFDAISSAIGKTYHGQKKHIIRPDIVNDQTILVPGLDENGYEWDDELTNGSIITVPENTCAVILSNNSIEGAIYESGEFLYEEGAFSLLNGDGFKDSFTDRVIEKALFSGKTVQRKRIVYINMRDIRNIMFGTTNPITYHDITHGLDLDLAISGRLTIRISNAELFIKAFVPTAISRLSAENRQFRTEIRAVVLQELTKIISRLSGKFTLRDLSSNIDIIRDSLLNDKNAMSYWEDNYGFVLTNIIIEHCDYTDESKESISRHVERRFEDKHEEERTTFRLNTKQRADMSFDDQIEAVKKLKELKDMGIISSEEFEKKKKDILGL